MVVAELLEVGEHVPLQTARRLVVAGRAASTAVGVAAIACDAICSCASFRFFVKIRI